MFLVVAKKWRTLIFSFPCSADERVCRSREGAEPGNEPKLANGNTPYHRHHAQYLNRGWQGGHESTCSAQGQAVQWVIGWWEKLCCVLLVWNILYYYYFLCCLIKLSLSQPNSFTFLSVLLPTPLGRGGVRERLSCQLPGKHHNNQERMKFLAIN